jgi:hypothetical protein
MPDEATITKLIEEIEERLARLHQAFGTAPDDKLRQAARAVVFWRYYDGDDGWEKLKNAIGELEDLVVRPAHVAELYSARRPPFRFDR